MFCAAVHTDLLETIWKEALKRKKNVLRGSGRLTGGDPDAPVASGAELADELWRAAGHPARHGGGAARTGVPVLLASAAKFPGTLRL